MCEIGVDEDDLNSVQNVPNADIQLRVDIFLNVKSISVEFFRATPDVSERNTEEAKLLLVNRVAKRLEDLHIALDLSPWLEVVSVKEVGHGKKNGKENY